MGLDMESRYFLRYILIGSYYAFVSCYISATIVVTLWVCPGYFWLRKSVSAVFSQRVAPKEEGQLLHTVD